VTPLVLARRWSEWRDRRRRERELVRELRHARARFRCSRSDYLCGKYGCPDDPTWTGDRA
jgi:hypothetical protein